MIALHFSLPWFLAGLVVGAIVGVILALRKRGIQSARVWRMIKRIDPTMEDALRKPLDPAQYVKRDFDKTPRKYKP